MRKYRTILFLNIILIAIWIMAMQPEAYEKDYQINMTVEADVPQEMVKEVGEAMERFSVEILDSFIEDDWKVVLLTTFEAVEEYESISKDVSVVGLINYQHKTITVKGIPEFEHTVENIIVHEMCHYADYYWGGVSTSKKFLQLYDTYCSRGYITYSYFGISVTGEYENDIAYATSSPQEFFAESLKDYLLHPEYLQTYYPEIHEYYRLAEFMQKRKDKEE